MFWICLLLKFFVRGMVFWITKGCNFVSVAICVCGISWSMAERSCAWIRISLMIMAKIVCMDWPAARRA